MFVEWSKCMIYPLCEFCVFHKLSYENGKIETSCEYPFIDITECLYEKNEECIHKMTCQDLYEDWVRMRKRLSKYDLGGKV